MEDYFSSLSSPEGSCWQYKSIFPRWLGGHTYEPETFYGSFKGIEPVFRKRNIYSYQNEYRFAFYNKNNDIENKIIRIGSLSDFAKKIPIKFLNEIKIELSGITNSQE
ncbi:hypothetical protein F6R98_17395 [Candidatus Methylospira mobilis]|uniref:Uncharacterized protein n=1 Tax=Candidatus Methylospira mobilis TaxID=1808979 RepID=A0A5Q0BPI0_9GAMM|nr:hypothetical protein [Candidatus Methylospira mobilis]QFY44191.1 hypothetical protein F6R98_17395 [Candidatus Methylospira mobilis]WNV06384.1 hypothetical protein RP726_08250 [Candidatus Methylospira mobilis]